MIRYTNSKNHFGKKERQTIIDLGEKLYYLGSLIGEGTYSKVFSATLKTENDMFERKVACKVINKKEAGVDFVQKFLPREIRILKSISHPNIVSVFDIVEINCTVYMLMGYCKYGDLLEFIRNRGALAEKRAKIFFKQIVSAISYLHRQDIAHRDLKCENIFLYGRNSLKIGDFGFARYCRHERNGTRVLSSTYCGSAAYAAPEIISGSPYNPKMFDLWSLGCILYIILTAQMPFDDSNITKMLKYQQNRMICFSICYNMRISNDLKNLLVQLLEPDVTKRASIVQVARCKWMAPFRRRSPRKSQPQQF